jgi:hypothetical protein
VESWDRPNVLAFREGRFYRYYFNAQNEQAWQPAEPLVRKLLPGK